MELINTTGNTQCIICKGAICNETSPDMKYFNCEPSSDSQDEHRLYIHDICFQNYIKFNDQCPICNKKLILNSTNICKNKRDICYGTIFFLICMTMLVFIYNK